MKYTLTLLIVIGLLINLNAQHQTVVIPVRTEINPTATRVLIKGLEQAKKINADLIILDMNTYGGLLSDADSMRTAILNYPKPIWVFINKNAASAGALISLACDSIFMQSGSSIGAATVVDQDGGQAPDKYQSYMRGLMRATAESHGKINGKYRRNPAIAEAMVDEKMAVDSISEAGQVITFTSEEALKYGYCEGIYGNIASVIKANGIKNTQITNFNVSLWDKLIGWLLNPGVRSILIAGIVLGLYFELQSPGLGFPSVAALSAAVLYFAPAYMDGLSENWELLLFVIGLALIMAEVLIIPGFGLAGVLGIVFTISGITFSMMRNNKFDFSLVGFNSVFLSLATLLGIFALFAMLILFYSKKTSPAEGFLKKLVSEETLKDAKSSNIDYFAIDLIHKKGTVTKDCKPEGTISIDDKLFKAKSISGYITKGEAIKIVKVEKDMLTIAIDV